MKMNVVGVLNQAALSLRRHSPEILVIGGVVGSVVGGILACVATTHLPEVAEKKQERMNSVESDLLSLTDQNEKQKIIVTAYVQTGFDYVKLYAPSVLITGLSLASILTGHNVLQKRHVSMVVAYTTLDTCYKQYRSRVSERFGDDVEEQIHYDLREEKIKEFVTDENGNEQEVETTVLVANAPSEYSRYFEQSTSKAWEPNEMYNRHFLELQQQLANTQLQAHGFLFLNDVYKMLALPLTKAGQLVGWVYDPENADQYQNDNHVDFRMKELKRYDANDRGGYVKTILLDFNVDGMILDHATAKALI